MRKLCARAFSLAVALLLLSEIPGFTPLSTVTVFNRKSNPSARRRRSRGVKLDMFNGFGPYGDFLNNRIDDNGQNRTFGGLDQIEPDVAAGTFRLAEIPVQEIKPGGLRLFLIFYLISMQNKPDRNSWKADQPSTEEYVVDFWFHDQTAILSIELSKEAVKIDRVGSSPSSQYLMQEAVIVQGVLNELDQCATDESVPKHHRLLVLKEEDAIERARDALAFG